MNSRSRRLFAIEEAYVTIFQEYSPFFNFPVLPGYRTLDANGWNLVYDLSNSNIAANGFIDPANSSRSVPFYAKWQDIYMTDLRWSNKPVRSTWTPSGLPYSISETIGYDGSVSFNAAHFSDALWKMSGFRKYWRIFIDVKASPISQVERSWELRGCSVESNDYSGSPITLGRSFQVKEMPTADAIQTLAVDWRARNTFARGVVPAENTAIEILDISSGDAGEMVSGVYPLVMTVTGSNYVFSYNSIAILSSVVWKPNLIIKIDGGPAGIITFAMAASVPPTSSITENISVNR